jgi:hypothetical protein
VARWLAAPAAPAPPDAWRGVGLEAVRSVTAGAERSGVGAVHCVPDAPLYMWGIGRCMLHVARPRRCRLSGACCCHCSAHRPALDAALGRLAPHHRLLVLRVQTGRALHGRYNMPRAAWSLQHAARCMVAAWSLHGRYNVPNFLCVQTGRPDGPFEQDCGVSPLAPGLYACRR